MLCSFSFGGLEITNKRNINQLIPFTFQITNSVVILWFSEYLTILRVFPDTARNYIS